MNSTIRQRLMFVAFFAATGCSQSDSPTAPQIDFEPPAAVLDLAVDGIAAPNVTLAWTAPGDDGSEGRATTYDLRFNEEPIHGSNWLQSTNLLAPTPVDAGQAQSATITLEPGKTYFVGIRALDENDNQAPISNLVTITVPEIDNEDGGNEDGGDGTIDLIVVQGTVSPPTVMAGAEVKLEGWGVKNEGTLQSPATRIEAYLSVDRILGTRDRLLGRHVVESLLSGHGQDYEAILVEIPASIPAGDYYIGLLVDPGNDIVETSEHNFGSVRITVTP